MKEINIKRHGTVGSSYGYERRDHYRRLLSIFQQWSLPSYLHEPQNKNIIYTNIDIFRVFLDYFSQPIGFIYQQIKVNQTPIRFDKNAMSGYTNK